MSKCKYIRFVAPIIVVLISRTCYATVCLNKTQADRASSLKVSSNKLNYNNIGLILVCNSTSFGCLNFGYTPIMASIRIHRRYSCLFIL